MDTPFTPFFVTLHLNRSRLQSMTQKTAENLATLDQAKQLGLLEEEFEKIKVYLGRTPNFTELSVYSVMWSEHC